MPGARETRTLRKRVRPSQIKKQLDNFMNELNSILEQLRTYFELYPLEIGETALALLILVLLISIRRRPYSLVIRKEARSPRAVAVEAEKTPEPISLVAPLSATSLSLIGKLRGLFSRAGELREELFFGIEKALISADVGVATTEFLVETLKTEVANGALALEATALENRLKSLLTQILNDAETPRPELKSPHVILVVGVNGVGKTTSIAKLAGRYQRQGKKVLLAAADTFRAAAVEQLEVWGTRLQIPVVTGAENAKPSTIAYTAVKEAQQTNADLLLIDTAGRLHNRVNLMQELEAVVSIIGREYPGSPHETFLVLDASTGQNAVQQAREFQSKAAVSGLIMTKLDGTPKGGALIAIAHELQLPIRYLGVGEGLEDLREFHASEFIDALFAPTAEVLPESEPSTHAKVRRTRRG